MMETHVIEEKAYCFTENEFSILLSAAGIQRILCFDTDGGKRQFPELGKRECNEAILSLIQAGVLTVEDEHYLVKEEVKNLIRTIKDSRCILTFYPSDQSKSMQCLYIKAENCFTVAVSGGMRSDYIRVSSYEEKTLREYLEELGVLIFDKKNPAEDYDTQTEGSDRIEIYESISGKCAYEAEIRKRNGLPREIVKGDNVVPYSAQALWEGIETYTEEKTDDIG